MRTAFVETVASVVGKFFEISPKEIWVHYEGMNPQDIWSEGRWIR
jgi:hypothetical protein